MFSKAFAAASGFTRPVVISSRTVKGRCRSAVGACIIVNPEGWILTAAHLVESIRKQREAAQTYRNYLADIRQMDNDRASHSAHRKGKLRHLARPGAESVRDHSVWWGADGVQLVEMQADLGADLALGRLEPFDPESVPGYPVFKTADAEYAPGRSLCRIGFPFHEIEPAFDEERGAFVLPKGAVPPPLFAIEGIFSRSLRTSMPGQGAASEFIETSSPGLQGQSGGPIFDAAGAVWALQSHTRHYPLGFRPPVPGGPKGHRAAQFLNVGVGVHAGPIRRFLDQHGIAHRRV